MSTTSGWGRLTWGQANWNQSTTLKTGWGAQAWSGDGGWGDLSDQTISLTGVSASFSIGTVDIPDVIITPSSFEITLSQGEAFVPVVLEESLSATFSVGSLTVNGSTTIIVKEPDHGRSTSDRVRFRDAQYVGGVLGSTINLAAGYVITKVNDDKYTFATSTTSSITETGGGGSVSAGPVTVTA